MMEGIAMELNVLGILFDADENQIRYGLDWMICMSHLQIRCFSHVINIAVKTKLKELNIIPSLINPELTANQSHLYFRTLNKDLAHQAALSQDVVAKTQQLVKAICVTGQQCEDFETVLRKGNKCYNHNSFFLSLSAIYHFNSFHLSKKTLILCSQHNTQNII